MATKKPQVEHLSPEQLDRMWSKFRPAIQRFNGSADELESALGMYVLGHYLGWRVLVLVHSKKTIRKYEDILDIKVREEFPEEGSQAHRSVAYEIARKVSNFWKLVSGEDKSIDREQRKLLN